jgi:prolyl oligopeptidase
MSFHVAPPNARKDDTVDHLWGEAISDPYRWMESDNGTTTPWLRAQDAAARTALAAIKSRAEFFERFKALNASYDVSRSAQVAGGSLFFLLRPAGAESFGLSIRSAAGAQRTLLECPPHFQIDYFAPSPDGRLVAIGLSRDGDEDSTLRVVAVDTGQVRGEEIAHTRFAAVSWLPTNDAFVYGRRVDATGDGKDAGGNMDRRVFLHHVDRPASEDAIVFGPNLPAGPVFVPGDLSYVVVNATGTHAVAVKKSGTAFSELFSKDIRELTNPSVPWRVVAGLDRQVDSFVLRGDDVFALSYEGSSNGYIERISLTPRASSTRFVAEAGSPISEIVATAAALLVVTARDGRSSLWRHPFDGSAPSEVPLPTSGTLREIWASPSSAQVLVQIEQWTAPAHWWSLEDTGTRPPSPLALEHNAMPPFRDVAVEEVEAKSADGAMVPLTILYRRPLKRDGSQATLLTTYGAYGVSQDASFRPNRLPWLERGGIVAIAHVRGGGERGEDWHRAGMLERKPNSAIDLVACAEYLIQHYYSSARRIIAVGESAGGIAVGNAMVRRPDLFGGVVIQSAMNNALRIGAIRSGPANTREFGNVETEAGFRSLRKIDTYDGVTDGVRYPAVLLTVGINDARIAPWQSAKLAARLQSFEGMHSRVLLRVDFESGHGALPVLTQAALAADIMAFAESSTQDVNH